MKIIISRSSLIDMNVEFKKEPLSRFLSVSLFIVITLFSITFSVYLLYSVHTFYMYIIAISFLVLSLISGFFNISTSYSYYRSYFYQEYLSRIKRSLKPMKKMPNVAVVMPVYNESVSVVEKNALRLKALKYQSNKIKFYLLDDSTRKEINDELMLFCRKHKIEYIHRKVRTGYKAGALNNMLVNAKEEFIAIFDYDEYLTNTNFLLDLLPYFSDKNVSYIQTEKSYAKGTFFSDTINLFDAFFFRFIQPSRALNNTAIFAGSCGIIRRSALESVGGFPEYVIEDTFFSFESDMYEFKSLYIPKIYALGKPIFTFSELAKQQWRYNYGDTQFLSYFLRRDKRQNKKKTISAISNIDYMSHGFGLNYLSAMVILFTIISVFIVFSAVPFAHMTIKQFLTSKYLGIDFEIFGIMAFVLSIITPAILTKIYFKSLSKGIMVFMLNFSLAFIRTKAAIAAVLNLTPKKTWTRGSDLGGIRIFSALRNSMAEVTFSSILFILGGMAISTDNISGGLWLLWYGLLYSSTFYFFYRYR
jgi:cellulose synthase/poly-beta-1,6-N-acetylglucosamine synthase-like glycosyltransferase